MSDADYERKLHELDRLLNDPAVPMEAGRIWALAAEVSRHDPPPHRPRDRGAIFEDAHMLLSGHFNDILTPP